MTARRAGVYAVNAVLVLAIAGVIGATWLPAIYVSPWFQHDAWVRANLLGVRPPPPATAPSHK